MGASPTKQLDVIIKLLMQCNLRCVYCYEQENLTDSRILSLAENRTILKGLKTFALKEGIKELQLGYTGGEVLMLGPQYLRQLFIMVRRTFRGTGIRVATGIQTNLTLLNDEFIQIFKKYKVWIGSSYDVFGGLRRFRDGTPIDKVMLDQLIRLFKARMLFAGIVLITRSNYKKARDLHRFYKDIHSSFHVLPLDAASEKYCPREKISIKQYIEALKALAREQLRGKKPVINVASVDGYAELLRKGPGAGGLCYFSKHCLGNRIFIQNDGNVYPCDDFRSERFRMGNILKEPLAKIFKSPKLWRLTKRQLYIDKQCKSCRYLPLCNGGCMTSAYGEGVNLMERSPRWCQVNRAMFKYVGQLLKRRGEKLAIPI